VPPPEFCSGAAIEASEAIRSAVAAVAVVLVASLVVPEEAAVVEAEEAAVVETVTRLLLVSATLGSLTEEIDGRLAGGLSSLLGPPKGSMS